MNGSEWYKNDTTYHAVYYINNYGKRELDVVTNNFGEWLKRENKSRLKEEQEPYNADEFWLEDVEVFSREEKQNG
tara:strand:+ start:195 stop:419 length:225 start_codon:yes stop_codon:yes gene_type:complete